MKLLHILALCAIFPNTGLGQTVHIIDVQCSNAPNTRGLCLVPNQALIFFETTDWNDGLPKKVVATMNGIIADSTSRILHQPGIDTISVTLHPIVPGLPEDISSAMLVLFNQWQTYQFYSTVYDTPCNVRTYRPPSYFDVGEPTLETMGETTVISVSVHASDWNLATAPTYDCGQKVSRVQAQLVNCSDGSIVETQQVVQSYTTPDYYSFGFNYDGIPSYLRIETSLVYEEGGISTPGYDSTLVGLVASHTSDCFFAGDQSTHMNEVAHTENQPFPNPFDQNCTVSWSGHSERAILLNMSGQTVWTGTTTREGIIDPYVAPGIYLVEVVGTKPQYIIKR